MTEATRRQSATRTADAGVTLIEVLVVLAILGATAGATRLALPGGSDTPTALREAQLLQARLHRAVDGALASLRPARLRWQSDGYVFEEWDGAEWQPHSAAVLAERHALAGGLSLGDDGTLLLSPDVLPPEGAPATFVLQGTTPVTLRFDGFAATLEPGA